MKNIQEITDMNAYVAFGFPVQNKPDQITYYCRYAATGTHTTKGGLSYYTFNGEDFSSVIGPVSIVPFVTENISGVSGGQMDDGNTVIFYVLNHADTTRDIYIIKADADNNFTTPVLFDWNTLAVKLVGGFFFGPLIKGDIPGEYFHIIYQVGSAPTRYRVSIVRTTDYWNTYSELSVLYDGTIPISETAGTNLGGGKFVALGRINNGGGMATFESTNYGVTWVRRPTSNLYWWNGGGPEIPNVYLHDGVFDIFYECRDTSMMHISKGNTVEANFGLSTPTYNPQEIYSYHKGIGGNPSLGYGSQIKLSNGKYFMIFAKEYNNSRANLEWAIDDLVTDSSEVITTVYDNPIASIIVTDPAPGPTTTYTITCPEGVCTNTTGIFNGVPVGANNITATVISGSPIAPAAPELTISAITTTSFRFDITNYTDIGFGNVRYLLMDLSTSPDFSTFVTCKYRSISAYSAAVINNIRVVGYWDIFNVLTTGTTYYLRIKAVNNSGSSDYTIKIVTTL